MACGSFGRSAYRVSALILLLAAGEASAAELSLKRVVLSTAGVGYFEYEAEVQGDASLSLDVALDQVDDVLKSLVVFDSGGTAGEITLPGREPQTKILTGTPFEGAASSLADLLNRLTGAELRIGGPSPISGRLVHVYSQTERGPDNVTATRFRLVLMTDAGLQQMTLDDIGTITFADGQLQNRLVATLAEIANLQAEKTRRLTLQSRGSGARRVRVGYVVGAPLWKSTYRLSLPANKPPDKARLQGWAVLENFSGQPWRDVDLTLISGNLVTFRQALYESYYVNRPTVPVEVEGRVLPQPDGGAVAAAQFRRSAKEAAPPAGFAAPAPPPASASRAMPMDEAAPAPLPSQAIIDSADASEGAAQIAFTLPYKISVMTGQSLLVPILDRELPARGIDVYQPSAAAQHPLAAVELTNVSDTGLPSGVLTLYQQNAERGAFYLGDARLAAFPMGDKRLLSYAVDSKVLVDRSTAEHRPIIKATIADGVLRITRVLRQTTTYRVRGSTLPSQLIIEHPRHAGYKLTAPDADGVELTAGAYRIPVSLSSAGETSLGVAEDQPLEETIRLMDSEDDQIGALAASTELDAKLRQTLTELGGRRQAIARQRSELERLKEQRAELVEDESRLRDDLNALGRDVPLRKRLLDKFAETESAIDAVTASIGKTESTLAAAEKELASYVAALKL